MPVTLGGIALPDDIQWIDEFSGFGVGQTITPTLTGALVIEESAQTEGRKVTLSSNGAWVSRTVVESLATLAAAPLNNATLTLVWADARTFQVVFDRTSGDGFSAQEVKRLGAGKQPGTHPYNIEINLLIKGTP